MDLTEKTIKEHIIFQGKILEVHDDEAVLPNGKPCRREIVRHPGGAAVLLVKEEKMLFVRQFRYAYGEEILEIPAGKIERGTNEPIEVCAARELAEETGYVARKLHSMGVIYPTPGYTDELLRLYLCLDAEEGTQHLDADEFLRLVWLPLAEVKRMIVDNTLKDAKSIVACLRYFNQLVE